MIGSLAQGTKVDVTECVEACGCPQVQIVWTVPGGRPVTARQRGLHPSGACPVGHRPYRVTWSKASREFVEQQAQRDRWEAEQKRLLSVDMRLYRNDQMHWPGCHKVELDVALYGRPRKVFMLGPNSQELQHGGDEVLAKQLERGIRNLHGVHAARVSNNKIYFVVARECPLDVAVSLAQRVIQMLQDIYNVRVEEWTSPSA